MDINNICLNCFNNRHEYDVCPTCGFWVNSKQNIEYLLNPGTILRGRYIVGTMLGVGGFGATYKAWDASLNIKVAIKEFYPVELVSRISGESKVRLFSGEKQQAFTQQLDRFWDEAHNLALLSGESHVVNVFDFFKENGTAYIIMEYLNGNTLKEYIVQKGGKIPQQEVVSFSIEILEGLNAIHNKGIIHRDISPDNIFVLNNATIKILDFGSAFLSNQNEVNSPQSIVIKIGYAPPEQYRNNLKHKAYTDIYAVGATMYKMITGITPEESIDRIEKDFLLKPIQLGEKVSSTVDKVVMKAMALKQEFRFQSTNEMLQVLLNQKKVQYPEDELKSRKLKRLLLISSTAVVVFSFLALLVWLSFRS